MSKVTRMMVSDVAVAYYEEHVGAKKHAVVKHTIEKSDPSVIAAAQSEYERANEVFLALIEFGKTITD